MTLRSMKATKVSKRGGSCSTECLGGGHGDSCRSGSGRFAAVIPQRTTEPLVAYDLSCILPHAFIGFDQPVVEPLAIPLSVSMRVKGSDISERPLQWPHDRLPQLVPKLPAVFGITVQAGDLP